MENHTFYGYYIVSWFKENVLVMCNEIINRVIKMRSIRNNDEFFFFFFDSRMRKPTLIFR